MYMSDYAEDHFELPTFTPPARPRRPIPRRRPQRRILWHRVIFALFCFVMLIYTIVYVVLAAVSSPEEELLTIVDKSAVVERVAGDFRRPFEEIRIAIEESQEVFVERYEVIKDSEVPLTTMQEIVEEPIEAVVEVKEPILRHFARISLTDEQVERLEFLVTGEAVGEIPQGQIAVAAVFINRILSNSSEFGFGFDGVFNNPGGFSCVVGGNVYLGGRIVTPERVTDSVRNSVQTALNGNDPTNGALFFYNPRLVSDHEAWRRSAVTNYMDIGNHRFYRVWPHPTLTFQEWLSQQNK